MTTAHALEQLYAQRADELLAFFLRRTADPQIAADLWAETFAQTVAGHPRRQPLTGDPERDTALLFAIAHANSPATTAGGTPSARNGSVGAGAPRFGADPAAVLEDGFNLAELRAAVRVAVDQIPGSLRDAVQLRVVEQHPYPEVAARLQITEQAARARVSRGLRALAHLLPHPSIAGAPADASQGAVMTVDPSARDHYEQPAMTSVTGLWRPPLAASDDPCPRRAVGLGLATAVAAAAIVAIGCRARQGPAPLVAAPPTPSLP